MVPAYVSLIMARSKAYARFPLLPSIIHSSITVTRPPSEPQKSSQIVKLPDDVLFIIADHLSLTDRARFLQTCRYFRSLLEVTQYRHIRINMRWLYYRSGLLHRTLSERPDLTRCIVSYCGPLTGITLTPPTEEKDSIQPRPRRSTTPPHLRDDTPVTKAEAIRRAINIFSNAVNLRELNFLGGDDWVSNPIWEPLRTSLSKMSLNRLALLITSKPAVEIVPLLRALPGLESLELSWVPPSLEGLNADDIPKLKSLTATLQDAAAIIPGRPVGEFHLVRGRGERELDEQLVRRLSHSSSPIIELTADLRCWDHDAVRSALQAFARHLPEIQRFTFTVGGVVSGQVLLDELPSFQSLRSVRFLDNNLRLVRGQIHAACRVLMNSDSSTGGGIARQTPMSEDWDVLVQSLRTRCPSLVDIEHTPAHCY